jgi:hypothetical protein
VLDKLTKLDPEDSDFLIDALYATSLFQPKLFGFVKYLAVEAVLPGILIALGGASFCLKDPR